MKKIYYLIIIVFIVLAFIIVFIFLSKNKTPIKKDVENTEEILFNKQGKLWFIGDNKNDTTVTIDIEIADDEAKREQGLMYRQSMDENQGMLFIFDESSPRYFWMKNTYISLDIIYIDENFKIVSIQKTALPRSEESLPSEKPAKYVVEVNAGFTDKYKIKKGDKISFLKY
jgi:hypothetical protein